MNRIIGIIPAAGMGTRLNFPYAKELLPVSYKDGRIITVLESNLIQLANAHIKEAIIVINTDKEVIHSFLGDHAHGVSLRYVYQTEKLSREGLPDAVATASPIASDYDIAIMLMGDVYFTDAQHTLWLSHLFEQSQASVGVSVWETQEPWRFGVVQRSEHKITGVLDKPMHLTPPQSFWGSVAFRPAFWPYIFAERETFSHAISQAAQQLSVIDCPTYGKYLDLGTPQSYIQGILEINQ